jgi:hypothetical protein
MSSFTQSIYLFLGRALLGCPSTFILITLFVMWLSSLRITWPYLANILLLIFTVTDATFKLPLIIIPNSIHSCHSTHPSQHSHFRHIQFPFIAHLSGPTLWSIQHYRSDDRFIDFPLSLRGIRRSHIVPEACRHFHPSFCFLHLCQSRRHFEPVNRCTGNRLNFN